jgi:hypothetical protein
MKSKLLMILVISFLLISVFYVGFKFGKSVSQFENTSTDKGTFILSLGALEEMRAGNTNLAINKLESLCYSSALQSLKDPRVVQIFGSQLLGYRAKYATNVTSWTQTEVKLEKMLNLSLDQRR